MPMTGDATLWRRRGPLRSSLTIEASSYCNQRLLDWDYIIKGLTELVVKITCFFNNVFCSTGGFWNPSTSVQLQLRILHLAKIMPIGLKSIYCQYRVTALTNVDLFKVDLYNDHWSLALMNNGALCKEYFNVILQTKSFDKGQICLPDAFGEICVKILGF